MAEEEEGVLSVEMLQSVTQDSQTLHFVSNGFVDAINTAKGGPDGLLPQHLKDMTGASAESGGPVLLSALTSLVNIILQGKVPSAVRPLFFGANLTALTKKDGGVRPIAVGCTLR